MVMTATKEVITDITAFGGSSLFLLAIFLFAFVNMAVFWQLVLALITCYALTIIIRTFYFRQRPDKSKVRNIFERIAQSSFPSLHAMRAAALGIIVAGFFAHPAVPVVLVLLIILTAFSRVYLKRHFISDVIVGTILGIAVSVPIILYM